MSMEEKRKEIINHILNELLSSGKKLSEAKAKELSKSLLAEGEEALTFLLLELAAKVKLSERSPSTPSGMIPVYEKESVKPPKKKKKAGGQPGHQGTSRPKPERIDKTVEHRLECCPDCGGPLQRGEGEKSTRSRVIEDIPETIQPEITEHVIHRDYCPSCKKQVEPKVESALPKATLGNRVLILTAYWHYLLGMTISQIRDTLNYHLHFQITKGGLIQKWHQLQTILMEWDMALGKEVQESAVVHADETGWRVNGQTHWLWCFTSADTTFYMVDRSRGSPALKKFFQEEFNGVLVTDFWASYNAVLCLEHQCCLFHLLNELEKVNQRNRSEEWKEFSKKLKRLIKDAIRLRACEDFTPERYKSRIDRFYERLLDLALASYTDKDTRRLAKRLEKYRDELLVFLTHPNVPSDNNHGEREIRMAVIMRKMSYGNRSEDGALTQSVLMTVLRTLKRRGYNPIVTLVSALAEYIRTGKLPQFPPVLTSDN